jgi:hypothetical protein
MRATVGIMAMVREPAILAQQHRLGGFAKESGPRPHHTSSMLRIPGVTPVAEARRGGGPSSRRTLRSGWHWHWHYTHTIKKGCHNCSRRLQLGPVAN